MAFQHRHRTLLLALLAALAHAGCSSDKATGPAPVAVDSVPPIISHLLGPHDPVALGGEIEINFTVRDAVGVRQTILTATGAFEGADTIEYAERPPAVSINYRIPVPDEADVDQPVVFTLVVSDDAGHTRQGQTSVRLADLTPPQARLDLGGFHSDETIRTGEMLDIFINAEDNHRLTYIGYEGGGLRDSVPASGTGDSHAFGLNVPASWLTQRPILSAWARDGTGRLSPEGGINRRQVPVYDWVERPIVTVHVEPEPYPKDVLWDARRNSVYRLLSYANHQDSTQIDGVEVVTGTRVEPIKLTSDAHRFALSVSGDSLVVTIPYQIALGIVDLLPSKRVVTMLPVHRDEITRAPSTPQAAGGRFFVSIVHALYGTRLLEVNFSTGAQVVRTDIDGGPSVPQNPSMLRLPDGRLVIAPEQDRGYDENRVIYSPASDAFSLTRRLRSVPPSQYTASPSGRFMMRGTVYGSALDSITTVSTQDWSAAAAALSTDGLSVYLATPYGYEKVRVSDGLVLEQVKLGMASFYLFATPDGSKLIAVGESAVKIVDIR